MNDECECMCDFGTTCGGDHVLRCLGCGGDQCVCAACFGQGEAPCWGCEDCVPEDGCDDWLRGFGG